ncbi:MAG: hypothetical protein V1875_05985 [Candidatus Altiarchaeota archaeon]
MNRQAEKPEEALKIAEKMIKDASEAISSADTDGPSDYVLVEFAYEKKKPQFDEAVQRALEGTSILRNMRHGNHSFGIVELSDGKSPEVLSSFLRSIMESHRRVYVFVGDDSLLFTEGASLD